MKSFPVKLQIYNKGFRSSIPCFLTFLVFLTIPFYVYIFVAVFITSMMEASLWVGLYYMTVPTEWV
jgi:hypothetical protein